MREYTGLPNEQAFERLTISRVRVLALLAARYHISAIAQELGYSYHGTRSRIEELKDVTGCRSPNPLVITANSYVSTNGAHYYCGDYSCSWPVNVIGWAYHYGPNGTDYIYTQGVWGSQYVF